MKRRWFAVLGVFLFVSHGAVLVAFGFPAPVTETVLSLLPWMFAGVLFVLGGLSVQIETIEWHQFVGAANVFMGIGFGVNFSLTTLRDASLGNGGVIFAVAGIAGGLSMVFIGMDWIRGGRHFEISRYETGPILGFMSRNRT